MKKMLLFFRDVCRFRTHPQHVIAMSSFRIMRRLDMVTLGLTTGLLKLLLAPRRYRSTDAISQSLRGEGFVAVGNFSGPHLGELMRLPVYCRANKEMRGSIDEVAPAAGEVLGRLDVDEQGLLQSAAIAQFIVHASFLEIAKKHYGREVVCVRANAWWSIPTTQPKNLDGAAQKFHRDIDWLGELKFFTFATDVTEQNGPFDFMKRTHRKRLDRFMLRDGRIEETEMFATHDAQRYLASTLCAAGDAYGVDTRGYHRGRPLVSGRRCVLSIEFSVNKFGVEQQYRPRPMLDPAWESYATWKSALEAEPAWGGLFSA